MKKSIYAILLTSAMIFTSCAQKGKVKTLTTKLDSVSYAVGLTLSQQLKQNFKEVDKKILLQAIENGLDSTNLLIGFKENQLIVSNYFREKQQAKLKEQQEKARKEAEVKFADNKKAGEDFLAQNKSKDGIITTSSGLQYKVLKEGKGASPKPTDKIKIHYHGTTITGDVFDSTVEKNKPYEARANQFISGFNEGLALLKVGSKYRFFIPQELGYGYQQRGEKITPFSTLIFEVELLEIKE